MAGWLGDTTVAMSHAPILGSDDYLADLDGENIIIFPIVIM